MARRAVLLGFSLMVAVFLCDVCMVPVVSAAPDSQPVLLYTVAPSYEPLAWMHGQERFDSGARIFIKDATGARSFVTKFAASADPAISFDGKRLLFSGKRRAVEPWQIWEMSLDGSEPRRVTSTPDDCIRPFYLPEDRIVYARRKSQKFLVEVAELTGGKALQLTYSMSNSLPTDVLQDGRILFEAGYPLGSDGEPEVYTVYSDGSGVESYRCDHGKARRDARQINSGDIVFATAYGAAKFTSARARELRVPLPAGQYDGDVAEMPSGNWLVSWRAKATRAFQLMRWTPGSAILHPVVAEKSENLIQPVVVSNRVVPNRHPSGLHDWRNANLLCLNAYTSKYHFPAGAIQSVRVYTRDNAGEVKVLGTAAVERDGSFFVEVPPDQPLQIELLDSAGRTLKRQSGFFWMRRGEQRGCVGCHAGPETAPENAVPMILLKSTTPADMTGANAQNDPGGH